MPQDPLELLQKANMLFMRGNYKEALELLSHAEKSALENESPDALAAIYYTIGNILRMLGNFENAKKYLEQSLEIFEQLAAIDPFYNALVAAAQNVSGLCYEIWAGRRMLKYAMSRHWKCMRHC